MPEKQERNVHNECYCCKHRRDIPGDAHSRCVNPDNEMTGNAHGLLKGWFFYPLNFDPVWKMKMCRNWEDKNVNDGTV